MQQMRLLISKHILRCDIDVVVIKILIELHLYLDQKDLDRLCRKALASKNPLLQSLMGDYLSLLGEGGRLKKYFLHLTNFEELDLKSGPKTRLPIIANRRSKHTAERWMKKHDFCHYQFTERGVYYRGMDLIPGDMVLSSVNLDGNGVYTSLIEPKGYAYHFGMFAIIEENGKQYPVIVETYELGARIVPLSQFFSVNFNCYFEVYRAKALPDDFYNKINILAKEIPSKILGYNFDTEDPDHSYLACTSVATYLFQSAGVKTIPSKSNYSLKGNIISNLDLLELVTGPFLSPWDFIASDRTTCVGLFDNNYFTLNIARELCEQRLSHIFKNGTLHLSDMPIMYLLNGWGVRCIQENKLLGKVISRVVGFTHLNLPRASYKILASIEVFDHLMARCVRKLHKKINHTNVIESYQGTKNLSENRSDEITKAMRGFYKIVR